MNADGQPEVLVEAPAPPGAPAAAFQFGTLLPEISFQTVKVPPPAECYISPGDSLLVQAWNVVSGLILYVNTRILKSDGTIIQNAWTYTPTSGGATNFWRQGLVEGFLLSLDVFSYEARAGACYVRAQLQRGAITTLWVLAQTMVSGYVTRGGALTWPYPRYVGPCEGPGRLRLITGTDPAPGAQITEVVPTGVRWRLLALMATLSTSGDAGSRDVMLCFGDSSWVGWQGNPQTSQPANTGYWYTWLINADARLGSLAYRVQDRLPDQITLAADWRFYTAVSGMFGNDNWAAPVYYVEEWVEP